VSRTTARLLLAVVALAALIVAVVLIGSPGAVEVLPAGSARVVEVIDGDTVVLDVGGTRETARLLGIDTPEVHHPTKPVECGGAEASARLGELLPPGRVVRIERDQEARDHYGRMLAYLFVAAADGGEAFVNELLVREGAAVTLPIDPNDAYRGPLAAAEAEARRGDAGLWGACGGPGVALDPLVGR
jgi:micrococcal nuclease